MQNANDKIYFSNFFLELFYQISFDAMYLLLIPTYLLFYYKINKNNLVTVQCNLDLVISSYILYLIK